MNTQTQPSPELQAVLSHQQTIAEARAKVEHLTQALAEQQAIAEQLRLRADDIAALETEREDLLADIATGQDKATDLKTLDARLAQLKTKQGTQAAIDQTVAGLARKLEKAQGDLKVLQEGHPRLMRALLLTQAEALGAEYVAVAMNLRTLYCRLHSLGHLLSAQGQIGSIAMNGVLDIPAFSLESVQPYVMTHRYNYIEFGNKTHGDLAPAIQSEKAELQALGVHIA